MGRLTEAHAEAKSDFRIMSPQPVRREEEEKDRSPAGNGGGGGGGGGEEAAAGGANDARADGKGAAARIDGSQILELVSEYLFDLFDANCMDEFKTLEDFESEALVAFDPDVEEFTFEQERLHGEFCALFEGFCEKFISAEGYSMEEFYEIVRQAKSQSDAKASSSSSSSSGERVPSWDDEPDHAVEVVETIYGCSDFRTWAEHMREEAGRRRAFLNRRRSED